MNKTTELAIEFSCVGLLLLLFFLIGFTGGVSTVQNEAVRNGVARYEADELGRSKFEWVTK